MLTEHGNAKNARSLPARIKRARRENTVAWLRQSYGMTVSLRDACPWIPFCPYFQHFNEYDEHVAHQVSTTSPIGRRSAVRSSKLKRAGPVADVVPSARSAERAEAVPDGESSSPAEYGDDR